MKARKEGKRIKKTNRAITRDAVVTKSEDTSYTEYIKSIEEEIPPRLSTLKESEIKEIYKPVIVQRAYIAGIANPDTNLYYSRAFEEKMFRDYKEKYNGKLVFIDMFNGINFGSYYDLNNYQDMSQKIFPQLRKLCNDYKVTIIIVHHLNRKGKSLGSTAIDTCVDGKLALKQDENIKSTFYLSYESRDYPSKDYVLKRNDNLILSIDEDTKETLNPNLIQFLKYAISKKEFTFTISEMVSKLNLFITPPVLGKLIASNKEELEKLGLFIECKRTQTERLYTAKYKEPLEILTNDIFSVSNSNNSSKEENYGS